MRNIRREHRLVVYAILFFLIICPTELIYKTERFYYVISFALLFFARFRDGFILKRDFSWSILFYILYAAFTLLWSSFDGAASILFAKLIAVSFLFLQLQCDYSVEEFEIFKTAIVIQYIFVLVLSLLFGYTAWDGRLWIVNGTLATDGNSISAWLILPCCVFIERMMKKGSKLIERLICLALLLSLFYLTYWTGSRAGIVAIVAAAVLSLLYTFRDTLRKNIVLSFVVLIVGAAIVFVGIRMLPDAVIQRFTYVNSNQLGGRTVVWRAMFDDLISNPLAFLFGFGESSTIGNRGVVAHCLYIEALYNQGLFGLLMIVYFMLKAFGRSLKNDHYIAIAFIGIAIVSASLSEFASRPVMLAFFFSAMNIKKVLE